MARIVVKEAHGNLEIKTADGKSVFICQCGLSKNQPYCDGSHNKTLDEEAGKIYAYNDDGTRDEVGDTNEDHEGCCGGGCCGGSCCGKSHEE